MATDGDALDRIQALERQLGEALERIAKLESRGASVRTEVAQEVAPITPPPVIAPFEAYRKPAPQPFSAAQTTPPPRPPEPRPTSQGIEYILGAKALPWVGAVLLIIAFGYFVAMGIERKIFSPTMQFVTALLASGGFLVVGIRKRDEREDFGNLLTGIGSCGVFLSFAGGHVFQKLYEGELLVGLFLAWSFVNILYANFVRSRVFLAIGYSGGLAAAFMPLSKHNYSLHCALAIVVVLSSLIVAIRHRWPAMVMAMGAVSGLLLFATAIESGEPWMLRTALVFSVALSYAIGYVLTFAHSEFDANGIFSGAIVVVAGASALAILHDPTGALVQIGAGIVATVVGYALRNYRGADKLMAGGVLLATCLAPSALSPLQASICFTGVCIVSALLSRRFSKINGILALGWITFCLGFAAYLILSIQPNVPWTHEAGVLLLLCGSAVACSWMALRTSANLESSTLLGAYLLVPLGSRLAWVSSPNTPLIGHDFFGVVMAWTLFAFGLAMLGGRRWKSIGMLSWGLLMASLVGYTYLIPAPIRFSTDLVFTLVFLGAALVAASASNHHAVDEDRNAFLAGAVSVIGLASTRILYLVFTSPLFKIQPAIATIGSLCLVAIGIAVYTVVQPRPLIGALAWAATIVNWFVSFDYVHWQSPSNHAPSAWMIGVVAVVGVLTARISSIRTGSLWLVILLNWQLVTDWAMSQFSPSIGDASRWVMSGVWIGYGVLLLAIGAWQKERVLRLGSFVVFGYTVLNVLSDLGAKIDPIVRIAVLFFFGLSLLAGGYWYIRTRAGLSDEPVKPQNGSTG